MNDFVHNIATLSNHFLYRKIKECIMNDYLRDRNSTKLLKLLYDEAQFRDDMLYKNAIDDASVIIDSINMHRNRMPFNQFYRTEYMNIQEFKQFAGNVSGESDSINGNTIALNSLFGIDKDDLLICEVNGDSMIDADIHNGDIIFAENTQFATNDDIIIASLNGKLYVKVYNYMEGKKILISRNKDYPKVEISDSMDFKILGKVKKILKSI